MVDGVVVDDVGVYYIYWCLWVMLFVVDCLYQCIYFGWEGGQCFVYFYGQVVGECECGWYGGEYVVVYRFDLGGVYFNCIDCCWLEFIVLFVRDLVLGGFDVYVGNNCGVVMFDNDWDVVV